MGPSGGSIGILLRCPAILHFEGSALILYHRGMSRKVPLIVLIDEDGTALKESKQLLEYESPEAVVMTFGSAYRFRDLLKNEDLALVVTELGFGDGYTGKNLIEDLRQTPTGQGVACVVLTKKALTAAEQKDLERLNATVIPKPLTLELLRAYLARNPVASVAKGSPVSKRSLSKGSYLFRENEEGDSLFILQTGKLEALKKSAAASADQQNETRVAEILPGQVVGEMSVLDGRPRSLSIRAVEDSLLLELRALELRAHLSSQPAWLRILIESALDRLRTMNEKLLTKTPQS